MNSQGLAVKLFESYTIITQKVKNHRFTLYAMSSNICRHAETTNSILITSYLNMYADKNAYESYAKHAYGNSTKYYTKHELHFKNIIRSNYNIITTLEVFFFMQYKT